MTAEGIDFGQYWAVERLAGATVPRDRLSPAAAAMARGKVPDGKGPFPAAPGFHLDAAAYVAVRHYLRAVVSTESLDADQVNEEMRTTPVYFFGRSARLRLDGRLTSDLALLRVKPPEAMGGDWDHYEQIGIIPVSNIYRPLSQTGCVLTH